MALDAAHRASIYEKLRPILGDEDANALMSQFPAIEADEPVTKEVLRAELAELRTELTAAHADLRAGLRTDLTATRTELVAADAELRRAMSSLEARLTLRLGAGLAGSTALLATIGLLA